MRNSSFAIPREEGPWRSILLFGPPGSGKGTLGKFLSSAGNHYHLSSGDIFRGLSPESEAGRIFHRYASKGQLVPDEVMIAVWRNYMSGLIATNAYFPHEQFLLLDGIPRTVSQVDLLAPFVDLIHVIVLEMPNQKGLVERLKRRGIIERRVDDFDESIIIKRMEVYESETTTILSRLPKEKISRFNADQPPLQVLRDVLIGLSDLLTHSVE